MNSIEYPSLATDAAIESDGRRICLLAADSDSQVFGASAHARAFARRGWRVIFAVPKPESLPQNALERIKNFEVVQIALEALPYSSAALKAGVIGVFATGSKLARFRQNFEDRLLMLQADEARPAIFTGYNGLVYEKFEEGLAWRLGYDFVALNGPRDARAAKEFLGADDESLVVTGIGHDSPQIEKITCERPSLLFAEQVVVPSRPGERVYLARELVRIARENPGWDVIVKPRVRPTETTFHQIKSHISPLIQANGPLPDNLLISYEPIESGCAKASVFCTISSTALFTALRTEIPSFVIGDFGVRNGLGTHVFARSGVVLNLRDIHSLDELGPLQINNDWVADLGFCDDHREQLIDRIESGAFVAGDFRQLFYSNHSQIAFDNMRDQAILLRQEVDRAKMAYRDGRFSEAIEHFELAFNLNPGSSKILRMKAECEIAVGAYQDATETLKAAQNLKPDNRQIRKRLFAVRGRWLCLPGLSGWAKFRF